MFYPFCGFFLTKQNVIHHYKEITKIPVMTLDRLANYKERPRSWEYREEEMQSVVGTEQDLNQLLNPAP